MIPRKIEASYPCFSDVLPAMAEAHTRADATGTVFSVIDAGRKQYAVVPLVAALKNEFVVLEHIHPRTEDNGEA